MHSESCGLFRILSYEFSRNFNFKKFRLKQNVFGVWLEWSREWNMRCHWPTTQTQPESRRLLENRKNLHIRTLSTSIKFIALGGIIFILIWFHNFFEEILQNKTKESMIYVIPVTSVKNHMVEGLILN